MEAASGSQSFSYRGSFTQHSATATTTEGSFMKSSLSFLSCLRWRSVILGIFFGLFMSAVFTSNFATRASRNSVSAIPAQLYILFFGSLERPAYVRESALKMFMPENDVALQDMAASARMQAPVGCRQDGNSIDATESKLSKNVHMPESRDEDDFKYRIKTPLEGHFEDAGRKHHSCDLSVGQWREQIDDYPLYGPGECPFVDEGFNCHGNGRPDTKYMRLRWSPQGCLTPRFNGTYFLERMKGKRLAFVGDSLNRNQWESMLCILWASLSDKSRIIQLQGGRISKLPGAYVFKFLDYNVTVEFYTTHFLVFEEMATEANQTLIVTLDRMDASERRWRKADVLIFNTGHWWTPDKINGVNCFREAGVIHSELDVMVAYRKAIRTWLKWVDKHISPNKTRVLFRSYSPVHYEGGQWNSGGECHTETQPNFNESSVSLLGYSEMMQILEDEISSNNFIEVLNVTMLSELRKDGHPSIYGHNISLSYTDQEQALHDIYQDCSHWCLPGVPDIWNELLYYVLLYGN